MRVQCFALTCELWGAQAMERDEALPGWRCARVMEVNESTGSLLVEYLDLQDEEAGGPAKDWLPQPGAYSDDNELGIHLRPAPPPKV
jgi:hypothetical protein